MARKPKANSVKQVQRYSTIQKHVNPEQSRLLESIAPSKDSSAWDAFLSLSPEQLELFFALGKPVGTTKKTAVVVNDIPFESITQARKKGIASRQTIHAHIQAQGTTQLVIPSIRKHSEGD